MRHQTPALVVPARFCGPPGSGNGGWTAGALAAWVGARTVTVSLRRPPPLDTPMPVALEDGVAVARHGDEVVARAKAVAVEPTPVAGVPLADATRAAAGFPGFESHYFPRCFACGPEREEGDGLRIFPGPVGGDLWAAPWTPADDHDTAPVAWAALDCVSGWAGGFAGRAMVLASMTVRVDVLPAPGTTYVVVGEHRRTEGRKTWTASAVRDPDGALLGTAEHLWIAVDADAFR